MELTTEHQQAALEARLAYEESIGVKLYQLRDDILFKAGFAAGLDYAKQEQAEAVAGLVEALKMVKELLCLYEGESIHLTEAEWAQIDATLKAVKQ